MNQKDGENKFDFIENILKKNIGNLTDDFLASNMGNTINKYIADSFSRWIIIGIKESKQEIIQEIENTISKYYDMKIAEFNNKLNKQ